MEKERAIVSGNRSSLVVKVLGSISCGAQRRGFKPHLWCFLLLGVTLVVFSQSDQFSKLYAVFPRFFLEIAQKSRWPLSAFSEGSLYNCGRG